VWGFWVGVQDFWSRGRDLNVRFRVADEGWGGLVVRGLPVDEGDIREEHATSRDIVPGEHEGLLARPAHYLLQKHEGQGRVWLC